MFGEDTPGCCGLLSLSVGESLRCFFLDSFFEVQFFWCGLIWIVQRRKGEEKRIGRKDINKVHFIIWRYQQGTFLHLLNVLFNPQCYPDIREDINKVHFIIWRYQQGTFLHKCIIWPSMLSWFFYHLPTEINVLK